MTSDSPYKPPSATLETGTPLAPGLAGRGTRLGAVFIDGLIQMPLALPLLYFVGAFEPAFYTQSSSYVSQFLFVGFGFALFAAIQSYFLHNYGQTIGKRLLKIKIVHTDYTQPTLSRLLFFRYLPMQAITLVPFLGQILNLVNVLFIFANDRRCLHDHVAGTMVVNDTANPQG